MNGQRAPPAGFGRNDETGAQPAPTLRVRFEKSQLKRAMDTHLSYLVALIVLGVSAQWIAWRVNLPSILLLLLFGIIAGPITGFFSPSEILGPLQYPIVSISVALILFEGGLSLRWSEVESSSVAVRNLVVLGPLITWLAVAALAYTLIGFSVPLALLIGALFIVTGPTVIGPLFLHIRPTGRVGPILKWESIITDPFGAILAVLVFESLAGSHFSSNHAIWGGLRAIAVGSATGGFGALALYQIVRHYRVPDSLQIPFSIMVVLMTYLAGNMLQEEAGLLGVTLMGVLLANQSEAPMRAIIAFKENLRTLLISCVFIVLGAQLELSDLQLLALPEILFAISIVLVVRPLSVFISTWRSGLSWREKIFLCAVCPRGIVAAAVASVLGTKLFRLGHGEAELLVPITFLVIFMTVIFSSVVAGPLARALGLADPKREGVVFLGGHEFAREFAAILEKHGFPVLLIDSNPRQARQVRWAGLPVWHGDVLAESTIESLDLSGLGRFVALTPNDEVNTIACLHFGEVFGSSEVYQLANLERNAAPAEQIGGRRVFGDGCSHSQLEELREQGAQLRATLFTDTFDLSAYAEHHGEDFIPLAVITAQGELKICSESKLSVQSGDRLVSLVPVSADVVPTGPAPSTQESELDLPPVKVIS